MSEEARLSHLDAQGRLRMVDVGDKQVTRRTARARARVHLSTAAMQQVLSGTLVKGDVRAVARIAAIQAAKRTADLVPLCHPLPLDHIEVEVEPQPDQDRIEVRTAVGCHARTGVEMEALVAAAMGAVAVIDMCKAVDRDARIEVVEVIEKTGGRRGTYRRAAPDADAHDADAAPEGRRTR